jgi:hypothetical protein
MSKQKFHRFVKFFRFEVCLCQSLFDLEKLNLIGMVGHTYLLLQPQKNVHNFDAFNVVNWHFSQVSEDLTGDN